MSTYEKEKEKEYGLYLIECFDNYVGNAYHNKQTMEQVENIYNKTKMIIASLETLDSKDLVIMLNMLKDIKNHCYKG